MHGSRKTLTAALAVFVVVTGIDATVLYLTRDRHIGIKEDHFEKGVSLYETGSMLSGATPSILRPPGYPVFVATTLAIQEAAISIGRPVLGEVGGGRRVMVLVLVLVAHTALLGLLGAAILLFSIDRTGTVVAAACAVSAGCNPLLLLMAGYVSYELLHLVLVTIATLMLVRRAGVSEPNGATMFGNGLIWGAATLVKAVTLIAPAFVLLWASLHYGVRKAARTTTFFAAGLLLVVAPWTARNYAVTGRFIPVNEQAPFALWATSLERIPSGAHYLPWVEMWFASGMKTYTEVTGVSDYSLVVLEEHLLELSDRFRVLAGENLRRDPNVYAYNVLHNSVMFIVDSPTSWYFAVYGWPRGARAAPFVAGLSVGLMTVIAVIAVVTGCVQRDPRWTLVVALFATMWTAHALTFLEPRYLYVKLPTIVVGFVFAGVVASADGRARWRRGAVSVATLAAILSIVGLFAL